MKKLLVQGDDFGFTKAVTLGIVDAIDNGVLRNTGLFTNMPSTKLAVSYMKDRPHVCFGIDFNIVSGKPVADPKEIPHLVDENGEFIRSGVRVKDERYKSEEGRRAMFPYDEVYKELRAQYDRFVELTGEKPGYLHGHSLQHEHYLEAIMAISDETGVPYSKDIQSKYGFANLFQVKRDKVASSATTKKIFDPMEQLNKDPFKNIIENEDYLLSHEYIAVGGHPGYVDNELLSLTTLSLERVKDHAMMTSKEMKKWIEDNDIELITYYDLY